MAVILHKAPTNANAMNRNSHSLLTRLQALLSGGMKKTYHLCPSYRMTLAHSRSWKLLLPPCGPLVAAEGWKNRDSSQLKISLTTEEPCSKNPLVRDRDQPTKSQNWKYRQPPGTVHFTRMQNHLLKSRVLRSFPYK